MTLLDLTAAETVKFMRSGDLKVSDYLDILIPQIKAKESLNVFITFDEDMARAHAAALDHQRASGGECGLLFGLPVAVKDNIETSDYVTTGGTGALKNYRPAHNAPFLQKMLDQGALVLGKTNLHELAMGITSNNGVFGPVHNPHNPDMIAGGSSGGSAVAVATHMSPFAIGTDTGGSARIPPALCGIVGFRPTMGRYGSEGAIPISHTRDTIGTMARTVADIQLIDQVVMGFGGDKPLTDLKGVRLGVARQHFYDNLDREVAQATDDALKLLKELGAELIEADIAGLAALNEAVSMPICLYEAITDMEKYLETTDLDFDQLIAGMGSPDVKGPYQMLLADPLVTKSDYRELLTEVRPKLLQAYRNYFQNYQLDAMVFPTTILPARPIGQDETVAVNGAEMPTLQAYIHNTEPSSNSGIPGVTVPMGMTEAGLPLGLEFDGPEQGDVRILQIADVYQKTRGQILSSQ